MTVAETLLVYVGFPLLVVLVLAALTLPRGRKRPRWKSGQEWPHEPVWYEPHPESTGGHGGGHGDGHAAIGAGATAAALPAGASDGGARPVAGGPLGGARGTW